MSRRIRSTAALVLLSAAAGWVMAGPATRPDTRPTAVTAPADVKMKDVDGVLRRPLACAGGARAAVVFFLAHDCPISNAYAAEINRIARDYGGGGRATFTVAYPLRDLPADEARTHAKAFGYTMPVVIDTHRTLTRAVGARTTPEVAVVGRDGTVVYRGRIDDLWADYGKRRPEPTRRDLRAALDAVLAGQPVPAGQTEPIGCPIDD